MPSKIEKAVLLKNGILRDKMLLLKMLHTQAHTKFNQDREANMHSLSTTC